MSSHHPSAPFLPPAVPAGDSSPPLGGPDVGGPFETALPFTGSVFTAPIAILGLVLTFAGWVLMRLGLRED